jgi:hypothetical protein
MSLSEVTIPQAGTGPNVGTLVKTETNGNTVQIERVAIDTNQLVFSPAIVTQSAAYTSSAYSCEGCSKVVVKVEYSTNSNTAKFYVLLGDFTAVPIQAAMPGVTPVNTQDNTNITTVSYFHGETFVVSTNGAEQVILRMETPSAGSVSAWIGTV